MIAPLEGCFYVFRAIFGVVVKWELHAVTSERSEMLLETCTFILFSCIWNSTILLLRSLYRKIEEYPQLDSPTNTLSPLYLSVSKAGFTLFVYCTSLFLPAINIHQKHQGVLSSGFQVSPQWRRDFFTTNEFRQSLSLFVVGSLRTLPALLFIF